MFDEYKLLSLEYDYKWVNMAFPSRGKWKPNFKQKFHCLPENATLAVFVSPRCFSLLGIFWYKSHKTCLLFLVPNSALKFRGLSSNTRTGVCQVVHWLPLDVSSVLWYTNLIWLSMCWFFKNAYWWVFDMQIYILYVSGVLGGQKRALQPLTQ